MEKIVKDFNEYNKRQRQLGLQEKSFDAFCKLRRGRSNYKPKPVASGLEQRTFIRNAPKYPSGDGIAYTPRDVSEKRYTGDRLVGIATMHKSNSVPVFSQEDAVDIARMRRG